jgi:hypothetical protein
MYLKNELVIAYHNVGYQDSLKITAIDFIKIVKEDSNVLLVQSNSHTKLIVIVILFNH